MSPAQATQFPRLFRDAVPFIGPFIFLIVLFETGSPAYDCEEALDVSVVLASLERWGVGHLTRKGLFGARRKFFRQIALI